MHRLEMDLEKHLMLYFQVSPPQKKRKSRKFLRILLKEFILEQNLLSMKLQEP